MVVPPVYRPVRRTRPQFLDDEVEHWVQESRRGETRTYTRGGARSELRRS
jgi:hypothetical protein